MKKLTAIAASLLLIISAAACGSGSGQPSSEAETSQASAAPSALAATEPSPEINETAAEGTYHCLGVVKDETIITLDNYSSHEIELKDDGTGRLYFGDDNQGPVSSWSVQNRSFTMKAGVSDFTGTLNEGIMYLDFGDGLVMCFAKKEADKSGLTILSAEEYKASANGTEDSSPLGLYEAYAIERNGEERIIVAGDSSDEDYSAIELFEGGTGRMTLGSETVSMTWEIDGEKLTIIEEGTSSEGTYPMTIKDGIIKLVFPVGTASEIDELAEYFVREGADVSWLKEN